LVPISNRTPHQFRLIGNKGIFTPGLLALESLVRGNRFVNHQPCTVIAPDKAPAPDRCFSVMTLTAPIISVFYGQAI